MRRLLGLLSLTAAVSLSSLSDALACRTLRVDGLETTLAIMAKAGRPNYADGLLICDTIASLRRQSPTFADLLEVLRASPHVRVLLATSTDLRHRRLVGRTRFSVGPDATTAFVELLMDRTNLRSQREAVAHELAHVAEVVCLGTPADGRALRLRLGGQGQRKGTLEAPIETGFAVTLGRVVEQEAADRNVSASRFTAIARRYGLDGCPSFAREAPMLAELSPLTTMMPEFPEDAPLPTEQEAQLERAVSANPRTREPVNP